jgi:hypothetical protein
LSTVCGGSENAPPIAGCVIDIFSITMAAAPCMRTLRRHATSSARFDQRFGTTERMPWFSTMRARVGYAVDSVMRGGIEGLVTKRWSMKLEYLYMGTPSMSVAARQQRDREQQSDPRRRELSLLAS